MGYSCDESQVSALALDAERCTLSTGFMSQIVEAFITNDKVDDKQQQDLHRLKLFADAALQDDTLAPDILEWGICHCIPFVCIGNELEFGALITVDKDSDEEVLEES